MGKTIQGVAELLWKDERGVTLVEYGIALVLVLALGAAAFNTLANEIGGSMSAVGSMMP